MKSKSLILILLLALGGSVFADRFVAEPKEVVRYVDVQRAIEGWSALQEQSEAMRIEYQGLAQALDAAAQQLKSNQADLDMLDPQSDEYINAAFQLNLDENTLKARAEFLTAKYKQQSNMILSIGVQRIHVACAELGEREGFSAILMAPGVLPDASVDPSDVVMELQARWVIWSNNSFDVTDQVVEILNNSTL
jgi:Skp family chaperone for outer membrane proteins